MELLRIAAEVVVGACAVVAIVLPYLQAVEHRLTCLEASLKVIAQQLGIEPLRPA